MTDINPAIFDWNGHEGLPRFDAIADSDFAAAFETALAAHAAEIDAIAADLQTPDFDNTVVALELDRPASQIPANRRMRLSFCGVTAYATPPKPSPVRVLTSTNTRVSSSAAITSNSPYRQRQLRCRTRNPSAVR